MTYCRPFEYIYIYIFKWPTLYIYIGIYITIFLSRLIPFPNNIWTSWVIDTESSMFRVKHPLALTHSCVWHIITLYNLQVMSILLAICKVIIPVPDIFFFSQITCNAEFWCWQTNNLLKSSGAIDCLWSHLKCHHIATKLYAKFTY